MTYLPGVARPPYMWLLVGSADEEGCLYQGIHALFMRFVAQFGIWTDRVGQRREDALGRELHERCRDNQEHPRFGNIC